MRRIALLAAGPDADAAWSYVASLPAATARRVTPDALPVALGEADVVWVHATDEPPSLGGGPLVAWVERGGRLLLTQWAASCVVALGLEDEAPECDRLDWRPVDDETRFPHVRGLAAYGPHPLFAGVDQGTYVWAPVAGEPYVRATYARGRRPKRGVVVACERAYIRLDADRIVAWEYAVGRGGVLCIGAFVAPGARDRLLERQLGAVLANALSGGGIPHAGRTGPVTHWPEPGRRAREDRTLELPERPALEGALPDLEAPLHASTRAVADEAFTLAGRRALVVGGEQAGVREIWMHPHRVLQGLELTLGGETALARNADIAPGVVRRHLVSGECLVAETVTTALEHPVVLLEYRAEEIGRVPPELMLRWTVDLRRMWPYPAGCGGDLRYRVAPDGTGLLVADAAGAHAAFLASRPVAWSVTSVEAAAEARCEVAAPLGEPLRLAVVGGVSRADLDAGIGAVSRRGVAGFASQRARRETRLREQLARLGSPDERLNEAFEWAKVRLDAALVDTPGIGRSLVAGYAASQPGWGDGRPGYAWYFGRDACWSAFALLAAGDFSGAGLVLRFLGDTQDVSGKVIHEYTTSGLAHYDAADSTPLYLLLAGRYAAWTGDLALLEQPWPQIERAYRFCLETDRDGDGLIENTRVGHGWIEMGPLAGAHVTLYLAAIWIAALEALAPAARALGKAALADELAQRAARARAAAASRFRTDDGYALGLRADGTPQRHRTALTAVALLLGAVDPAPAAAWLDAVAGPDCSAPWGVRLLSSRDPLYDPAGYHAGTVWPLYTGWTSLAEYACHRAESGFAHLMMNGRLPFARAVGSFDEVLRGDAERAAGVCPDQAWSAALLVSPAIEGLLGARPDALQRRLTLAPHLPAQWKQCEWQGLRVGHTSLDVRVAQRADRVVVTLRRTGGRRLDVVVAPALPAGRVPAGATVDDEPLTPRVTEHFGCTHTEVRLELSGEHDVQIWHRPQ